MTSLVALLRALLRTLKACFTSDEGRSLTTRLPDRFSLPLFFPMTSPPCDEMSEPSRIESAKTESSGFRGAARRGRGAAPCRLTLCSGTVPDRRAAWRDVNPNLKRGELRQCLIGMSLNQKCVALWPALR